MLVTVPAVPNHSRREALRNRHDVRWKRSCARLQFQRGRTSIPRQRDLAHHATGHDHAMRLGRLLQRNGPREADAQLACIEQRRAASQDLGLFLLCFVLVVLFWVFFFFVFFVVFVLLCFFFFFVLF